VRLAFAALSVLLFSCDAAGPSGGVGQSGVIVLGDSVAHGAGDSTGGGIAGSLARLTGLPVSNYGINGARTTDVLRAMTKCPIEGARAIVVSIGGNDLYGDSLARIASALWPEQAMRRTVANVETIVRRIHTRNASVRIYLLGLYDPYSPNAVLDRSVNSWDALLIARFASDPRVTVIRIVDLIRGPGRISSTDHFHPSSAGYALIAARIAPSL
jgi:lysophospholipase L1-like esterase